MDILKLWETWQNKDCSGSWWMSECSATTLSSRRKATFFSWSRSIQAGKEHAQLSECLQTLRKLEFIVKVDLRLFWSMYLTLSILMAKWLNLLRTKKTIWWEILSLILLLRKPIGLCLLLTGNTKCKNIRNLKLRTMASPQKPIGKCLRRISLWLEFSLFRIPWEMRS